MATDDSARPAAGWYPDPGDPRLERMWDGERWDEQTRSRTADAPEPRRPPRPDSGWSGGAAVAIGFSIFGLLLVGGCAVVLGVAPLLAVGSGEVVIEEERAIEVPAPQPTVGAVTTMPDPEFAPATTAAPDAPDFVQGRQALFGAVTEVVGILDEGQPSTFDITVGEPIDVTEGVIAESPLNAEALEGVVHVAIPVTITLQESPVDPLPAAGIFDWTIVGGATATVYRPARSGSDDIGCGSLDEVTATEELSVAEVRTTTVCIPIPGVDFGHPDTRIVLTVGDGEPTAWSR